MDLGTLSGQLTLSISQFTASINQAAGQAAGLGQKLNNSLGSGAAGSINKTTQAIQSSGASFKDLGRIVSGILISQLFYSAIGSIKSASAAVVDFSANMEAAQISMEYFLGSKDKAQGFLEVMKDFAATTPFSTEQAIDSSRRLMAMGFAADSLKSVMTIMTDAASATGATAEQMDRVVLALGQMKTNGFVAGQELRQLAEAGIPSYKILQEQLGLTQTQLKNIGKLKINGDLGVTAILQGLEKRYKGAADRIANTYHGMWSTIKDDALIGSQKAFQGTFASLENLTRGIRDFMERARKILTTGGIGGLFQALVPKELQGSIKDIIAGFEQVGKAIGILYTALKPLVLNVIGALIKAFGVVMPVIGFIAEAIAYVAQAALQASPIIKLFAEAIILLLIANTVSKALMFLWTVTRVGVICAVVAQAVGFLSKAIQLLFLVCTRNPIVGIITLIAAALLYLAVSSKTVAGWLDAVGAKISALGGVDISKMLVPENNKSVDDWMSQFNKQLKDMQTNLTGTGKSAAAAGKAVKDTFVSSFDELFQIPDKLDAVGNSLSDISLDVPTLPTIPDVKLPTLDTPNDKGGGSGIPWGIPMKPKGPNDGPPNDQDRPKLPPPDGSPVTNVIDTINARLKRMQEQVDGVFASAAIIITGWAINTAQALGKWVVDTSLAFGKWVTDVTLDFVNWVSSVGLAIGGWVADTSIALTNWTTDTAKAFGTWVVDTSAAIGGWIVDTGVAIGDWVVNTGNSFGSWATDVGTAISTWATNAITDISTWATNTGTSIGTWVTDTGTSIGSWAANAGLAIATWASTTATNISTWVTSTVKSLGQWAIDATLNIAGWVKNTSSDIYNWGVNTAGNIVTWVNSTITLIGQWAVDAGQPISDWLNGTATGIAAWVNNVSGNFTAFANNAYSAISGWASSSWTAFSGFLSGTASNVAGWATGLIGTIVGWATSAWNVIKSLASAVGKELGSWTGATANAISNTYQGMSSWASDNKSWLVPVGVAAVVTGLAIATIATGGAAAPAFLALETGGIVDKDQMVRIGEGNKREAVIPLENSTYMKPFSAAVAADLKDMIGRFGSSQSNDSRTILYVGTLIADDRSLKELERKMEVIRVTEQQRKGL